MSLLRYVHTIRHLRPSQVTGRVWYRLRRPRPDVRPAPAPRRGARPWQMVDWRPAMMAGPTTMTFLRQTGRVEGPAAWQDLSRGRLWLYNLHYFDDLGAQGWEQRRDWHQTLVRRWIDENPPAVGAGWEPYPTSLRIVNWIKWALAGPGVTLEPAYLDSLAIQVRWLRERLETHILGNHLWANAKALVMAGVFFDGPEAAQWRQQALALLDAELREQILADGGHFERSPMYHAIVLEDVMDLLHLDAVFPGVVPAAIVACLTETARRMFRWLRVMSHPDGELSFFNDAAFGIAPPWAVIAGYGTRLHLDLDRAALHPVEPLAHSGYVRLSSDRAVVICDVAPVGPDYQPGHAHADTLSFELSLDGHRAIVNGGTSTYAAGAERSRQRATAAHSTVEVDGRNSSDVWGGFRVGRRATPLDVQAGQQGSRLWVAAAHDGYRPAMHRRRWELEPGGLTIRDQVEGPCRSAVARFPLHPEMSATRQGTLQFSCDAHGVVSRVPTTWHPQFGESIASEAVEIAWAGGALSTVVHWS